MPYDGRLFVPNAFGKKIIAMVGDAVIKEISDWIDEDIDGICSTNAELLLRRGMRRVRKHSMYRFFGFHKNYTREEIPDEERQIIKIEINYMLEDEEFKIACEQKNKALLKEVIEDFMRRFVSEYAAGKRRYFIRKDGVVMDSRLNKALNYQRKTGLTIRNLPGATVNWYGNPIQQNMSYNNLAQMIKEEREGIQKIAKAAGINEKEANSIFKKFWLENKNNKNPWRGGRKTRKQRKHRRNTTRRN